MIIYFFRKINMYSILKTCSYFYVSRCFKIQFFCEQIVEYLSLLHIP
jgi:hypothetical protein